MTVYRELVQSRTAAAIGAAKSLSQIGHSGLKGRMREIVIRDLLRPLLPIDVGLGTGIIITVDHRQSSEQDVVLFDRRILPPILLEQSNGVFPIESFLFSIEVKSVLTSTELRASHQKALELDQFPYHSGTYDANDVPQPQTCIHLIPAVFAFDSDLTGGTITEIDRYDGIRGNDPPAIKSLCIVGKGNWYWKATNEGGAWQAVSTEGPFGEVMAFLAGILNTYAQVAESRCRPRLGHYL